MTTILHVNAQSIEVSHTAKGASYKVLANHHDHLSPLELIGVLQVLESDGYRLTVSIMATKEKQKNKNGTTNHLLGEQYCTAESCQMLAEAAKRLGEAQKTG